MKSALVAVAVAAIVTWSPPARAQIPPELEGQQIMDVVLEGPSKDTASPWNLGVPLGAPVTRSVVREITQRIINSGRWTDVQVFVTGVSGGVRVHVYVVPRIEVVRVELIGVEALDENDLRREIGVLPGQELTDEQRDVIGREVLSHYRDRGYDDTRVRVLFRDMDDPATKVLRIEVREGRRSVISRVQVRGSVPPSVHLHRRLGFSEGDPVNRLRINESVARTATRIRAEGWLEARLEAPVYLDTPGGTMVRFDAHVGPKYKVRMDDPSPLTRDEIVELANLGAEPLSRAALQAAREAIRDRFQQHGFHDAQVHIQAEQLDATRGSLVIRLNRKAQLTVIHIAFPGASHFSRDYLREQIFAYLEEDLPGSSVLYPVDSDTLDRVGYGTSPSSLRRKQAPVVSDPTRTYYEPTYDEAIKHITELHEADGYLHVKVGPATLGRLKNNEVVVQVPVVEGPRTRVHSLRITGNNIVPGADLVRTTDLSRGKPFSYLALEEARIRILDHYKDRGHFYATVEPSVRLSEDKTLAEIRLDVVESFPVRVGEIIVRGAERTSRGLIRERLTVESGDLLRPTALQESQEKLVQLGVFSGVNLTPADRELPARTKDLVVTVTERNSQFLDFNLGFSTGEGTRGGFEYGYRNLGGYAVGLALRVQLAYQFIFIDSQIRRRYDDLLEEDGILARLERNVSLGLSVPHLAFLPDVRWAVDVVHARQNERDFGLDNNAVSTTLTWQPLRLLTVTLGESLENNNVDLLVGDSLEEFLQQNTDPRLERLLRVPEGDSTILSTTVNTRLDLRNNPFVPTKGFLFSAGAEYARTLATDAPGDTEFLSNFFKFTGTATAYVSIARGWVLATQVRSGRVVHVVDESRTYPNRSFFLGGADTMRGYLQDALISQDIADEIERDPNLGPNDVVRGGDTFFLIRSELRFPLFGSLQGGLFADVGNVWTDADRFNPIQLRPTAGLGLRLATPVGPLAFDYGFIILPREALDEGLGAFQFSIGLF